MEAFPGQSLLYPAKCIAILVGSLLVLCRSPSQSQVLLMCVVHLENYVHLECVLILRLILQMLCVYYWCMHQMEIHDNLFASIMF